MSDEHGTREMDRRTAVNSKDADSPPNLVTVLLAGRARRGRARPTAKWSDIHRCNTVPHTHTFGFGAQLSNAHWATETRRPGESVRVCVPLQWPPQSLVFVFTISLSILPAYNLSSLCTSCVIAASPAGCRFWLSRRRSWPYGIAILTTVPPPRLPSNVKKFAIGGSRAASALRMSCASSPPTTAQTGDISCAAVVARVLVTYAPAAAPA